MHSVREALENVRRVEHGSERTGRATHHVDLMNTQCEYVQKEKQKYELQIILKKPDRKRDILAHRGTQIQRERDKDKIEDTT
jgi:hypothetical protein